MSGGTRVFARAGAGERGREPLVEELDGNVDRRTERLDEVLGLDRLLAVRAAQSERKADDDPLGPFGTDEVTQAREPRLGRGTLDHTERPRDGTGRVGDSDAGAGGTVVEREHFQS